MDIQPILSTLRRHKVITVLLVLEIALSCAIVCNAVFLIGQRMQRMDLPSGVAEHQLVQIKLGDIDNKPDAKAQTQTDLAALRQIPGVKQVAVAKQLPFTSGGSSNGGIRLNPEQRQDTLNAAEYFGQNLLPTLGTRLVAGRGFRLGEYIDMDAALAALRSNNTKEMPQVAIVTRTLARRLWPGKSALGKTIYMGKDFSFRVIGVIARLARPDNFRRGIEYSLVWPIRTTSAAGGSYVLRTAPADRQRVLKAALAKLKALNPNRVVLIHRTYDQARRAFFKSDRSMAGMLAGVIVALLGITALGIVGLASFWVSQRRKQIGIRRALGATRGDILGYFHTENFLIVSFGIALGMVLAYGLNLVLMQHYELPRLPWHYLPVGAVALWLLGQLAVLAPALRASNVSPVVATRSV